MVQLLSQNLNLNLTETCFWAHFKFAMLGAEKIAKCTLSVPWLPKEALGQRGSKKYLENASNEQCL